MPHPINSSTSFQSPLAPEAKDLFEDGLKRLPSSDKPANFNINAKGEIDAFHSCIVGTGIIFDRQLTLNRAEAALKVLEAQEALRSVRRQLELMQELKGFSPDILLEPIRQFHDAFLASRNTLLSFYKTPSSLLAAYAITASDIGLKVNAFKLVEDDQTNIDQPLYIQLAVADNYKAHVGISDGMLIGELLPVPASHLVHPVTYQTWIIHTLKEFALHTEWKDNVASLHELLNMVSPNEFPKQTIEREIGQLNMPPGFERK